MNNRRLIIGITQGDSNGIGYEVIIKALSDQRVLDFFTPIIYGSSKLFGFYKKTIANIEQLETHIINCASEAKPKKINIINCIDEKHNAEPGKASLESAQDAIASLERASKDIQEGEIDAIVTAPINKYYMNEAGFNYTGHTEYFKSKFQSPNATMILLSDRIRTALVTSHIAIKDIPNAITKEAILEKLACLNESLKKDFSLSDAKIAVLGLNPHNGDNGLIGTEENEIIIPAIKEAFDNGILAFGPYSPDAFFTPNNYLKTDAVLAMYHDQGLAPFKALCFENGVNYTAGLPIVRCSPDHGTAFEIAGKDKADGQSMLCAIYTAIDICKSRARNKEIMDNKMPDIFLEKEEKLTSGRRSQIE